MTVWGAFSEKGGSHIAIINGNQKDTKFISTSQSYVLAVGEQKHQNGYDFPRN